MASPFTWNTKSKRYHDKRSGSFVSRLTVRAEADKVIDKSGARMKTITSNLRQGTMSLPDWQSSMADEIKLIHMVNASAARGGWDNVTKNDWKRISGYIAEQNTYLQGFAEDIYTGAQRYDGTLLSRASLYAEAARRTYERERNLLELNSGSTEERNILGGSDHCDGCVSATRAGWVLIGSLAPVGTRECKARCRCTMIYRTNSNDKLGSDINS